MVEQTDWRLLPSKPVILGPGPYQINIVRAFCLKHCEQHYSAAATVLRFFKGRISFTDSVWLSLKKHQEATAQIISRTNALFEDLERQRNR